jgi:tRNA(Ile2) C34 agmatinyltransferase TiaS
MDHTAHVRMLKMVYDEFKSMDEMPDKICPQCGKLISHNPFLQMYRCSNCSYRNADTN